MSRRLKELRTNWMYWRFRHVTRNRLRLRSWWSRQRHSPHLGAGRTSGSFQTKPRGSASYVHFRSARKTWIALLGMILALTALSALVQRSYVNPGIVYLVGTLIVIAAIYWAMRQV